MDKKVLIRLLQHRVNELEAALTSIAVSEQVHQIEIDILLSKIRMIYDDVKLLSQSKPIEELEPEPVVEPIKEPEPVVIVPEPEKEPEVEPMRTQEVEIKTKTTLFKEPKEKILTNTKMQAVDDIMVAIGLNDRFLFIRELFNNDPDLFKNTIETLNQKGSWEEAGDYLTGRFSWDYEDPTLILFLSFVKRRYI